MFPEGAYPVAQSVLLLGLLITGAGGMLLFDAVTSYQDEKSDIANAVEKNGTVQETGIEQTESGGYYTGPTYRPQIRYTYSYQGTTYTSTSVYSGPDQTKDLGVAQNVLNNYQSDQIVTVYVNAKTPSRSYLEQHPEGWVRYAEQYIPVFGLLPFGLWLLSLPLRSAYKHHYNM